MNNKVKLVNQYIENGTKTAENLLYLVENNIIVWLNYDWQDEDVIFSLLKLLKNEEISTSLEECNSDAETDLIITYNGKANRVIFKVDEESGEYPFVDATVIALNEIIEDKYEIRFCLQEDYGDSLGFLILDKESFSYLDEKYVTNHP